MKNILTSWKSSLVGLAGVILTVVTASQDSTFGAMIEDPKVQIALLIGILGFVAKDGNVTGGTVGQPSTRTALIQANQTPSLVNPPDPMAGK